MFTTFKQEMEKVGDAFSPSSKFQFILGLHPKFGVTHEDMWDVTALLSLGFISFDPWEDQDIL